MNDIAISVLVFAMTGALLLVVQRSFTRWERPYMWASFAAHIASVYVLIAVMRDVYGVGDMLTYHRVGLFLAGRLEQDFGETAPRVMRMLLQLEGEWWRAGAPAVTSTHTMYGISAWLSYFVGSSLHASCAVVAGAAFFGKLGIYRVFRSSFPQRYWRRLLVSILLMPSVVYWSSGIVKEAVAVTGIGLLVWGGHAWVRRRRRVRGLAVLAGGALLVGLTKPYVLIPFCGAAGLWYYWQAAQRTRGKASLVIKPAYFAIGAASAVVLVLLVGEVFPRYDVSNISDEITQQREYGLQAGGGSTYSIGDAADRSLVAQLVFAPQALATALLRPAVFEARNVQMAINGLEMLAITVLLVLVLVRRRPRGMLRAIAGSPELVFCLVFVFAMALGVGLSTTNLGTLSRYRMPMMPFFAAMLLVLLPTRRTKGRPGYVPHSSNQA